jgi:thiol-disulfide isomerase/thioredoxin
MLKFILIPLPFLFLIGPLHPQQSSRDLFRKKDELTTEDRKDKLFPKSYRKLHLVKLETGKLVRIDLMSKDFRPTLRVEDSFGKLLAQNEGEGAQAHLLFHPEKTETYRLIVTTSQADKTGEYLLTVRNASAEDTLALQANKLETMEQSRREEFLQLLKKYFQEKGDKLDGKDWQLAFTVGQLMERTTPQRAAEVYHDLSKLLAQSEDREVKTWARKMAGAGRRLQLPGKEISIRGTTLEGKEFDLKAYRGKVVLIEFWATWCGHCLREMPNIRQLHEKYKDQGFEVVAVSLDRDRQALEKFQERQKLPWICLHDKDSPDGNPLAFEYGILILPQCILVDLDGKVLSIRARGEELAHLLEKHLK